MRKVFIVICVIVTIISVTVSCQKHDDGPINIDDLLERLQEVDSDISLYSSTNSYQMTLENDKGEELYYYYIQTQYNGDIPEIEGVHLDAIGAIFDTTLAEDSREVTINGKEAIIYTYNQKEYLCWTISAEDSCIIEYVPGVLSEKEIIKMAESVY